MIKRRILGKDVNIKYKFPWRKKKILPEEKMIKTLKNRKEKHGSMCNAHPVRVAVVSDGSGHVATGKIPQDCGRALLLAADCHGAPGLVLWFGCEMFSHDCAHSLKLCLCW